MAEIDHAAEMRLPDGKTCGDCVHCRRCCLIFGHVPSDTSCDWHPSRFRQREEQQGELNCG